MKKSFLFVVLLTISTTLLAQKDVTRFLGIPVDGFKPEMIQKMKEKGFISSEIDKEVLKGEFNGVQVYVSVSTTNNKVGRIMLTDINTMDEANIKIRFNNLCQQFSGNSKYVSFQDYTIPEDENISYEMTVRKKKYEAVFYQNPTGDIDTIEVATKIEEMLLEKYSEEELQNPTEEIKKEMLQVAASYVMDLVAKRPVWFMISEYYGKYFISMFYDNEYNRANGEDL